MSQPNQHPKISILIAARNEETNIQRCLGSVDLLNFPKSNLEVLIGDDGSTDATAVIVKQFIQHKPEFKYTLIENTVAGLRGKANVLAQLASAAKGDFFFFCDADIAVSPTWISAILQFFRPDVGVVTGITRMKESNLLAGLLSLEWLFALSVMRLGSLINLPITSMGNNMAVSREAYEKVGGYEKVGFSVVEDYALFVAMTNSGFGFAQAFSTGVLSFSEPMRSFGQLQNQRKRWMQGVMESHWLTRFNIILSAGVAPFLIILAFFVPRIALNVFIVHYVATTTMAMICILLLKQRDLFKTLPIFWFYLFGYATVMLINYFTPGKVIWKGRQY